MPAFIFTANNYAPSPGFLVYPRSGVAGARPELILYPPVYVFAGGYTPGTLFAFVQHIQPPGAVHRYFTAGWRSTQEATSKASAASPLTGRAATPLGNQAVAGREKATPLQGKACIPTDQSAQLDVGATLVVAHASPLSGQLAAAQDQLTPVNAHRCGTMDDGEWLSGSAEDRWRQLSLTHRESQHPAQDTAASAHNNPRPYWAYDVAGDNYRPAPTFAFTTPPFDDGRTPPGAPPARPFAFVGEYTPINLFSPAYWGGAALPRPPVQTPNHPAYSWNGVMSIHTDEMANQRGLVRGKACSPWLQATRADVKACSSVQKASQATTGTSPAIDPPRPPVTDPPGHVTVTIPTQQAYTMLHTLSVTLLNGTPIAISNLSLDFNADSFAYQFSGQLLDKGQQALLYQGGGDPVQLVVAINGVVFKVIVERIEHSYSFGQRSINVRGRGLTALLGQPYEQPSSATQSSQLTIQQLAELLLPGGWTLVWDSTMPTPWLVPSGVYTYTQQTPIQALATLAQDIGCMLVPARAAQTITIMPRYPKLPWNFPTLSPDVAIPASSVVNIVHRTIIPPQANGVYVHGGEVGGKLGWVRLTGTDGARLAPTVSNVLMTDAIALRLRGERELAGQYQQPPIQSITLPMDNATFPMLSVGQHVEVTADGQVAEGIVNSVQLAVSMGASEVSVAQTIQIGEETTSSWALFKELLPRDPLLVATLASTDGTTSLMTLLDNGVVRVRGTGTVNGKYYIRAGKIDGAAPNMTQEEIVI